MSKSPQVSSDPARYMLLAAVVIAAGTGSCGAEEIHPLDPILSSPALTVPGADVAVPGALIQEPSMSPPVSQELPLLKQELPLLEYAHVLRADGPLVVLSRTPRPSWAQGEPELLEDSYTQTVRVAVDPARVPAELMGWRGRRLTLHGEKQLRCEVAVGNIFLIGRIQGYFGARMVWRGDERRLMNRSEVAADVWAQSQGAVLLVGELKRVGGGEPPGPCGEASWARSRTPSPPEIRRFGPAAAPLARVALARFRALSSYRAIAKDHRSAVIDLPLTRWEFHGGARPVVSTVRHRATRTTLVVVSAQAGVGCGDFLGTLTAAWKVTGGTGNLTLERLGVLERHITPSAATDLDRDGQLEIIMNRGRAKIGRRGKLEVDRLEVPSFECGC